MYRPTFTVSIFFQKNILRSRNHSISYDFNCNNPLIRILCLALILIIGGCGPSLKQAYISDQAVQIEKEKQQEIAFDIQIKRQKRLYEISYPLLSAASSVNIDDAIPTCGFAFCTKDTFKKDFQNIAQRYFNLDNKPIVYFVHSKFPAAKAGLKVGDRLININGNALIGKSFKKIMAIMQENQISKDKLINMIVERDGKILELNIEPILCCKYNVILISDDKLNAFSDGKNIILTNGIIRFTENDDELAFIVAHEIAHNVLGHVKKKRGNVLIGSVVDVLLAATLGINAGGAFGKMGGAAYSKSFEFEADYAGLYIVARAGYDVSNAPNFWRRMSGEHPKAMEKSFAASHPSSPERFVAMEKTVQEIKEKQRVRKPLIPDSKEMGIAIKSGTNNNKEE